MTLTQAAFPNRSILINTMLVLAGSVVAQVLPEDRAALAEACGRIRRQGATDITFARAE